ncbi:MAG: enoyl-CoA hydratase/isomerase family protein [Sphingomonadaceae bacterium]|nr:enoyl-CoA hydratase/isomerase family protein [Sphingomonadaceae bacterium]
MQELLGAVTDGVALVTLNRPNSLNALNVSLHHALNEALHELAGNSDVRCVVLTGAGRGFCSGGDLRAINAANIGGEDGAAPRRAGMLGRVDMVREHMIASRLLHRMGKPTVAMINGPCAGAGLSLAGACDFRVAGRKAVLLAAFTGVGLSGDGGGSWFWTQILGTAKARELYLLNERFDGERALAFGLVHRLVDDERLYDETMAMARRIAELPPVAQRLAKEVLNAAEDGSFEAVLEREALAMALAASARKPPKPT